MRRFSVCASALAAAAFLVGCAEQQPTTPFEAPLFNHSPNASERANGGNFGTPLSAAEEVMPEGVVNGSRARGNATFQLNAAGDALSYRLIVANIENVIMAHIHQGPSGTNGPVTVWLYPSTTSGQPVPPGGGRINGVIATGAITEADLVGPLAEAPLSALVDDLREGNAYVNVHTNDGIDPPNTGPGDFPGGEVRGQVDDRGH